MGVKTLVQNFTGSGSCRPDACRSVRLWHMREFGCLRVFGHPDFVTSVHFHPSVTGLFTTGCADGRVRLWDCTLAAGGVVGDTGAPKTSSTADSGSTTTEGGGFGADAPSSKLAPPPSGLVASAAVQQDMVTAVEFMPDGRRLVVGTMRGVCRYERWKVWMLLHRMTFEAACVVPSGPLIAHRTSTQHR